MYQHFILANLIDCLVDIHASSFSIRQLTFSSVGSDHRVVSMRVRLNLRFPKPSPTIRYDWKALSTDPGLQARYTEEVMRRFGQLGEGAEPSREYRRLVAANEEATRMCAGENQKLPAV